MPICRLVPVVTGIILAVHVSARAELIWENPTQEFQRSSADGAVEAHYAFKNTGPTAVTILGITSSCGCTVARAEKKTYAPGESGKITARFTFGNRKGLQRKVITVGLSDGTETKLGLNVSILEPLTVTPTLLFWRVGEGAAPKKVQLKAANDVPVNIRSVSSSSPRVTTQLEIKAEGTDYTLIVSPSDTAAKLAATVTVETDYPLDAPKSYQVYIRIK
jgi:Protein of unknown function (DUF1573)